MSLCVSKSVERPIIREFWDDVGKIAKDVERDDEMLYESETSQTSTQEHMYVDARESS